MKPANVQVLYNKKLGSGAFADVYLGELYGNAAILSVFPDVIMLDKFRDCTVAVKTLPVFADEFARRDFQQVRVYR